jgi:hypothetical protein
MGDRLRAFNRLLSLLNPQRRASMNRRRALMGTQRCARRRSSRAVAALVLAVGLASSPFVLAEDGGGLSLDDNAASPLGQVADLLGNGQDLNGQGASDLFQHDGDLNQAIDLNQTQVPANAGEVTPEQMEQARDDRNVNSQGTQRGQNRSR